ncbi:MAG: hypothetical protein JOZ62_00145, partial [Acidobacteriaceae bacterium]|nr:hypothetical protein [Acidobacteriaceae bacterium]
MALLRRMFGKLVGVPTRSTIRITLVAAVCLSLAAPQPAIAQLGGGAVIAAANAVVRLITNTIGSLLNRANAGLGTTNSGAQAFS